MVQGGGGDGMQKMLLVVWGCTWQSVEWKGSWSQAESQWNRAESREQWSPVGILEFGVGNLEVSVGGSEVGDRKLKIRVSPNRHIIIYWT